MFSELVGATAESVPLSALRPAPWNPRTISDERFRNLCRSLAQDPDFLQLRPVLATRDGTVFAGNMRLRAAMQLGWAQIPAILVDIPEQLARERALRDNSAWGAWDEDDLAVLLVSLHEQGSDLSLLGLEERELQQLLDRLSAGARPGLTDPDQIPPLPDEPLTRPGDLWVLGEHRIVCGDATDPEVLRLACDGGTSHCCWTDPPYGVNYVGGTAKRLTIKNDDPGGLRTLLTSSFAAMDGVLGPGAAIYVAHPAGAGSVTFGECFLGQGWRLHQTLVWVKEKLVPGHSDYQYRHEPVYFGYKPADAGRRGRGSQGWFGGNDATSVFEFPSARRNEEHPTSKPVGLVAAMLRNSSRTGDLVLDPFLGSGSTLIACEQLVRRCAGVDLDPRYVDVAVRRWEGFTGRKAERREAARLVAERKPAGIGPGKAKL